jgi:hypothetical protein
MVSMAGACNPRQKGNEHAEVANKFSTREWNGMRSRFMRLAQKF